MALREGISFSSSFFKKPSDQQPKRVSRMLRTLRKEEEQWPGWHKTAWPHCQCQQRNLSASLISGIQSWSLFCLLQWWGALSETLQHQAMENEAPCHSLHVTAHREKELRVTAQCSSPFPFLCTSSPEQRSLFALTALLVHYSHMTIN